MSPKTLFDKLWDAHLVAPETDTAPGVLYIDLHLIHEVTSPQAFTELDARDLKLRRPERTKATLDHSTPTLPVVDVPRAAVRRRLNSDQWVPGFAWCSM